MLAKVRPRDVVLVADGGAKLLGFIAVWAKPRRAYIDNLHVDPGRRGQGLGEQLMREAARRLARTGQRQTYLWVYMANQAAISFYARLGGRPDGRAFDRFLRSQAPCQRMAWRRFDRLAL